MQNVISNLSAIILAGGEGTRLQNFVKQIYGYARPKQYCTFIGTRSMLNHTVGRAAVFIPKQNLIVVANADHEDYLREEFGDNPKMTILQQPEPRETSAGILLPIMKIAKVNPDAVVVIMPSDHFILHEVAFMRHVKYAAYLAGKNPNSIVLLGATPAQKEKGYGWIETGNKLVTENNHSLFTVKNFVEKPAEDKLGKLYEEGALINTFVMIGKCSSFINHFQNCLPDLMKAFMPINTMLGSSYERIIINRFFKHLPAYNFSNCVLQTIPESLFVLEMDDVYWSDWGDEERIHSDLEKMNYFIAHY